jgi:predicted O-methyltransferase YrrM
MDYTKTKEPIYIKGKKRRLQINIETGIYKTARAINGLDCLPKWLDIIDKYLGLENKLNCLEIGSHQGQSATFILKKILNHPESKLICCDPWFTSHWLNLRPSSLSYEDVFDYNIQNNPKIIKFRGTNEDLFNDDLFKKNKFDLIYIDDDHTDKSVKLDIENCVPQLKEGGLIIFDDYNYKFAIPYKYDKKNPKFWCEPVKNNVDKLIEKGDFEVLLSHYQIILRKKI